MMVLQLVDLSEKSPLPEEALRFVSSEKRKRLFHMVREEDKKRGLVGEPVSYTHLMLDMIMGIQYGDTRLPPRVNSFSASAR